MRTKVVTVFVAALVGASSIFSSVKEVTPEYVDQLLESYFEIQSSLAGDDFAGAQAHAKKFMTVLGDGLPHELAGLRDGAKGIVEALNMKNARTAFLSVSNNLVQVVKSVGTSGKADVYKMRCPMAFNGKGGEWLQNSDNLLNPYYGSAMLTCGMVLEHVAEEAGDSE